MALYVYIPVVDAHPFYTSSPSLVKGAPGKSGTSISLTSSVQVTCLTLLRD